jgi:hypothetical protein
VAEDQAGLSSCASLVLFYVQFDEESEGSRVLSSLTMWRSEPQMQEVVMRTMTWRREEVLVNVVEGQGCVDAYIVGVLELGERNLLDGNLERPSAVEEEGSVMGGPEEGYEGGRTRSEPLSCSTAFLWWWKT